MVRPLRVPHASPPRKYSTMLDLWAVCVQSSILPLGSCGAASVVKVTGSEHTVPLISKRAVYVVEGSRPEAVRRAPDTAVGASL